MRDAPHRLPRADDPPSVEDLAEAILKDVPNVGEIVLEMFGVRSGLHLDVLPTPTGHDVLDKIESYGEWLLRLADVLHEQFD